MQNVEGHLDRDVFAGMMLSEEQHFGFVLVCGNIVADLDCPKLASFIGLANAERDL